MNAWRTSALLGFLALSACAGDATQIVVVVDADGPLDDVRVEVVGYPEMLGGTMPSLPTTAVLRHQGGSLGPYEVVVQATRAGRTIERRTHVRFVSGETLVLANCLREGCADVACGGETCGEAGCEPIAEVALPMWTGMAPMGGCNPASDAGVDAGGDSGPVDGGPDAPTPDAGTDAGCALSLCGVDPVHLPGDPVTPRECGGRSVRVEITLPGDAPRTVDVFPIYMREPGEATLLLEATDDPSCQLTTPFTVAGPEAISNDGRAGSVRDMDARLGAAFVVGDRGVYAVRDQWFDLSDAGGAPESLEAVRVYEDLPHVGPRDATRHFYRVHIDADLAVLGHDRLTIHADDDSETRALGRERSGLRLLLATKSGVYIWDGTTPDRISGRDIARGGAVALSSIVVPEQGDVWAIDSGGDLFNYSTTGGATVPDVAVDLGLIGDLELDEVVERRLWICGDEGLALYTRSGASLGTPVARLFSDCRDLAPARDGGVWAATSLGLERYDSSGARRALMNMPGGATHVATAHTVDARETWVLRSDQTMFVLRAGP